MNPNNTVSSVHQTGMKNVFGCEKNKSPRILFVGNSITIHGVNTDIGWPRMCGMAASSLENDYVHLIMAEVAKLYPNAGYTICAQADWEREYNRGEEILETSFSARDWAADIVIIRVGENTPTDMLDKYDYASALTALARYYGNENTKYIVTDEFWKSERKDECLKSCAEDLGAEFVVISDLGQDITNTAAGLFEHGGVACHPGDKGMRGIAERILEKLLPLLKEIAG